MYKIFECIYYGFFFVPIIFFGSMSLNMIYEYIQIYRINDKNKKTN